MPLANRWLLKTKTLNPEILYLTGIAVLVIIVFWFVALFFFYLADDWSSPAADERSIPAVNTQ
jgi:hypothetical protein